MGEVRIHLERGSEALGVNVNLTISPETFAPKVPSPDSGAPVLVRLPNSVRKVVVKSGP